MAITRNWHKPNLQPAAGRFGQHYLCSRVAKEKGVRPSKRRMRRQLGRLRGARK